MGSTKQVQGWKHWNCAYCTCRRQSERWLSKRQKAETVVTEMAAINSLWGNISKKWQNFFCREALQAARCILPTACRCVLSENAVVVCFLWSMLIRWSFIKLRNMLRTSALSKPWVSVSCHTIIVLFINSRCNASAKYQIYHACLIDFSIILSIQWLNCNALGNIYDQECSFMQATYVLYVSFTLWV